MTDIDRALGSQPHHSGAAAAAWLLAPGLALGLLGAHFYRAHAWWGVAACAALLAAMLAVDRPWAARLLQGALVLGTVEWVGTAVVLLQQRAALGQPWKRMVAILAAVALATAASALVFEMRALRRRYGQGQKL